MTIYDTIYWLKRPQRIDLEISTTESKIKRLKECISSPSGVNTESDKVQTSPRDLMSEIIADIDELEQKKEYLQVSKYKSIKEIYRQLEKIKVPDERTVLILYYIDMKSVKEIKQRLNWSRSTVYRIKERALYNLTNILGQSFFSWD